ncbi:outer membrane protein assembly factor BamA [Chitinimonas sp. BJB300]|uniref:outer membrane protein assembly factor BamA n=1 Tax=Chitinimonas sp. BJB300 TaxID=1559339 RepID=UPI000C0C68F9|nr:outer membrane protein assembly factor BamA [Chitinimonas sp. BJB300]PHV13123.1 outer membrane protein assembly factor BamA [Chitinimonas sp. BJB300]TSJ84720.1 outer membrane protein assembly factor BamA [Chitinimonas sp. BJB300]
MKPTTISLALLALYGLAIPAYAFEPFVIKEIRVEGIQRTEAGTVFNYLPVKVGDRMDNEKAQSAVKALFATGFYRDVRVEADQGVLIVALDERPVIASIQINGAKEFESDQLLKALRENGLAESRTFDQSVLGSAEQELKRQYYSRGKYAVQIKTTVSRLERNRVSIAFDISEGLVATIKQINLVGNQTYAEKELKDRFQLNTGGWFSWFTKSDQYSKPKLQADIEALRSFYLDNGYLEFSINSQQVALSDDKKAMFLTVNLDEGKQYKISAVRFSGDLIVSEADLAKLVDIQPGEVFSRAKINAATERISDRLADEGYAFANVNAVPEVNQEKSEAAFTFYVDPGRKTYVRRVNIIGNSRTRDDVIRRELRQLEAAPFAGWKVKRSKERLDLLGYFSEVNIDTPLVADTTDQVDVNVTVVEKQTGNIQVGAGYSQSEGMVLSGSIAQANIFGSGKYLKLELNTSKSSRVYALSFTNPYATPDGVSRGFDIYKRRYDASKLNSTTNGAYTNDTVGAGLRWDVPVSEYDSIKLGLTAERSRLTVFPNSPTQYIEFVNKYGDTNLTYLGLAGWARDTRDSSLFPTRGRLTSVNGEVALPGGTIQYAKLTAQHQWFVPLNKTFTFLWNIEGGIGGGYAGDKLPFYTSFQAGGVGSVRGYDSSSLGPVDSMSRNLGGNRRLVTNWELLFPMPGMQNNKSVRLSTFVDGGNVWGEGQKLKLDDLRYSAGLAFSWLAPVGPMKFSYAKPLNAKSGDKLERFQFSLGQIF